MNDRRIRRRVAIGIIGTDIDIGEKLQILRGMHNADTRAQIIELVTTASTAAGIDLTADGQFPWQDFFEFLKWLVPLILDLFLAVE